MDEMQVSSVIYLFVCMFSCSIIYGILLFRFNKDSRSIIDNYYIALLSGLLTALVLVAITFWLEPGLTVENKVIKVAEVYLDLETDKCMYIEEDTGNEGIAGVIEYSDSLDVPVVKTEKRTILGCVVKQFKITLVLPEIYSKFNKIEIYKK